MKKSILSIVLSLFIILPVASYEWGGVVTENAKVNTGDFSKIYSYSGRQSNGLSLWANFPFNKLSTCYLSTQVSYKYNYDISLIGSGINHIADLDLLKFNAMIPVGSNGLTISAGRFKVLDETAKIFSQNCDGLNLIFATPFVNTTVYAGYTGLLNKYNTTILTKEGFSSQSDNQVYALTGAYVPLLLYIDFPSLFLNQSLGLQASAFFDLGTEAYNRYYGTLSLKGPISGPCFYSLCTCFSSANFENISNYSSFSLSFFFNSVALKLQAEYASGKHAIFTPFRGFTSQVSCNSLASPEYTGALIPSLDFTFYKGSLYFDLLGKLVLGIPEESVNVNGVDFTLTTVVNIFSDMQFNTILAGYYDILNNNAESNYSLSLNLVISF